MREILNYPRTASHGFAWVHEGRPITTALLCDLNALLMTGMPLAQVLTADEDEPGSVRHMLVSSSSPTSPAPASPLLGRNIPRRQCRKFWARPRH
jgi:hypothetical protein